MIGHDLAFVGCRLLAIYWGVTASYHVSSLGLAWSALTRSAREQGSSEETLYLYFVPLALYVLIALFLWFGAARLARHVAPQTSASTESGSVASTEIQAIAFAAVGLFVLLGAIPELGVGLYRYANLDDLEGRFSSAFGTGDHVTALVIRLILGLLLVFNARGLSAMLIRLRKPGSK